MDYLGILRKAFNITWRHKYLWVLGFLVALASAGGNSSNINNTFNNNSGNSAGGNLGSFASQYLVVFIMIGVILFLVGVAIWILGIIAGAGLVAGVDDIEKERATSLRHAFGAGAHFFWRNLGLSILLGLVVFVLALVFLAPVIMGIVIVGIQSAHGSGVLAWLFCLIPALIIVFLLLVVIGTIMGILYFLALRFVVIHNMRIGESIRMAWHVVMRRKGETFMMFLTLLVTGILFSIVLAIPALILVTPSALMIVGGVSSHSIALIIFGIIGMLISILIISFIRGIYEVFHSTSWTLAFYQLYPAEATAGEPTPVQTV